jgi:hypothetical protein
MQVSEWLAAYPPAHDTDGLTRRLVYGGKRFYNLGSATVHGYKWMHEYVTDDSDLFGMVADGLAAALILTECAVALFEAQALDPTNPGQREVHYPRHLSDTMSTWAALYR